MALKKKQIKFCEEYVIDYNGTQAAIRSGYKESNAASQASRLLKEPEIIEKIKENQKEILKNSCLTEEKIINNLEAILSQCMSSVPVMEWDYSNHSLEPTGEYQFDSKGALKAIELLGKHLGMFTEKKDSAVEETYKASRKDFIDAINGRANEIWKENT